MAQIENVFGVTCPADCTDTTEWIAIEEVDPNCVEPALESEVGRLLMMHPTAGVGPADWTQKTGVGNWDDVIDNTDATAVNVKTFPVVGDVPDRETPIVAMTNRTNVNGVSTYTLNADIMTIGDETYKFLQGLQCGNIKPIFWYTTLGGKMFGKNEGIQASSIEVKMPKDRGEDGYEIAKVIITWRSKTDPDRITDPLNV